MKASKIIEFQFSIGLNKYLQAIKDLALTTYSV